MELHYHPRLFDPKKKAFKEYFFEFLMIFFAVTLGFFAEGLREHMGDRQKEKQYILSLEEDLKRDTAQLHDYIAFKKNVLLYCDSVQQVIINNDVLQNSNSFYYYTHHLARYIRYYPTERTIDQLKNAGNMRLITRWKISNAITAYDAQTRNMLEVDMELNDEILRYRRYLVQLLDLSDYDKRNRPGSYMDNVLPTGNPGFITNDVAQIKVMYNEVFTLKMFLQTSITVATGLLKDATHLLQMIQKEY